MPYKNISEYNIMYSINGYYFKFNVGKQYKIVMQSK